MDLCEHNIKSKIQGNQFGIYSNRKGSQFWLVFLKTLKSEGRLEATRVSNWPIVNSRIMVIQRHSKQFVHWDWNTAKNIFGLFNNRNKFLWNNSLNQFDVFLFGETELGSSFPDAQFFISGCNLSERFKKQV